MSGTFKCRNCQYEVEALRSGRCEYCWYNSFKIKWMDLDTVEYGDEEPESTEQRSCVVVDPAHVLDLGTDPELAVFPLGDDEYIEVGTLQAALAIWTANVERAKTQKALDAWKDGESLDKP